MTTNERFETADDAIAQLEREGFTRDRYDPDYPYGSRCGLVSARVCYAEVGRYYYISAIA